MKKNLFKWLFLFVLATGVITACSDDDDAPIAGGGDAAPIASFQFEVDPDNFNVVVFENFSQNATSYSWNFGDGSSSTEEDPTHTYAEAGTYTVTLTASNGTETAERSETITITDPDTQAAFLAGTDGKTWYLQREGISLGVGPAPGDTQWFSVGGTGANDSPLGDRPCVLDDEITFNRDGTVTIDTKGTLYVDAPSAGWLASPGCYDETTENLTGPNGEDLSAFANGGNYTYEFDAADNTLMINGEGAYIGLANKTSTGDNINPVDMKSYDIINMGEGDMADSLTLVLEGLTNDGNPLFWTFYLVSYENEADLPPLPSAQAAASFDFTVDGMMVSFTNTSRNTDSYNWDFGDGTSSSEENPTHTYAGDGIYSVTLTATGANGSSEFSQEVTISSANFSAGVLSDEDGKTWTLAPIGGAFKVGPNPDSGEFFAVPASDIEVRACQFDNEFTFFNNGNYVVDLQNETFAEPFMGIQFACAAVSDLTAPYNTIGTGDYSFTTTEATDAERATITVSGEGAYLGFLKAFNGGELSENTTDLPDNVTYEVFDYVNSGDTERITLVIEIADGNWWTITIQSNN